MKLARLFAPLAVAFGLSGCAAITPNEAPASAPTPKPESTCSATPKSGLIGAVIHAVAGKTAGNAAEFYVKGNDCTQKDGPK